MTLRSKLVWIVVGCALTVSTYGASRLIVSESIDDRELQIRVPIGEQEQRDAITAVGQCVRLFDVDMPADGFIIILPIQSLSRADLLCLIEELESVRHNMALSEARVR